MNNVHLTLFVAFLIFLHRAYAVGKKGHDAVARLAYALLLHKSKTHLHRIFGHNVDLEEFASLSIWADSVANSSEYSWSKNLHFTQNGACLRNKNQWLQSDCVITAVPRFVNILLSGIEGRVWSKRHRSLPLGRIPQNISYEDAYKFLVHFVGDLHAPFHIGDEDTKNANEIGIVLPLEIMSRLYPKRLDSSPKNSAKNNRFNLHGVWDSTIIDYVEAHTGRPISDIVLEDAYHFIRNRKKHWNSFILPYGALHDIVKTSAMNSYQDMLRYGIRHETGDQVLDGDTISEEYIKRASPIVLQQLKFAGINLALILNTISETVIKIE